MARIATQLGIVGLRPKGTYSSTTSYERLDVVDAFGGSFLCLKTGTGVSPVESTTDENWQCIAKRGAVGPQGTIGATGLTGPQGKKGDPFVYADFTQEQLVLLKGPKGDTGSTGPKGEDGTSVHIIGTKESESELPTDASAGDAYLIDGNLWVFGASGTWINVGEIKGPKGDIGPAGANGKTAYASAQSGGYAGTEADFNTKLATAATETYVTEAINTAITNTLGGAY